MNNLLLLATLLLLISLAALAAHNLRLRRERAELRGQLRRSLDADRSRLAQAEREALWYRSALRISHDAVLITDAQKSLRAANRAAEQFFAAIVPGEGLIQRVRDHHLESLVEQALRGEPVPPTIVELPERTVQARVGTWELPESERSGAILYMRDVTELTRLLRARRDMVANFSHELRTPLASVKLLTGTLLDGAVNDPDVNRRLVNRIATENEALIRLVEDLSALNSIETGRMPLNLERADLRALVEQRLQRLQPQMELKEMHHRVLGSESALVEIDPERFGQVLTNVLDNAIKYSPVKSSLTITIAREEAATILEVSDEGPGIIPRDLPRIFERFYKGDRSRTRGAGGTGLGLAIAKHLVEAHGGTISARNNEATGATFRITLPD